MNPSTASEIPATTNRMKAVLHRCCMIMTITKGTMMRRPMVMMFGMVIGAMMAG